MTEPTSPRSAPTLLPTDLVALLEVHRRLLDAALRCNGILAGAVRAWAERQATIAGAVWCELGGAGPASVRAMAAGEPLFSAERAAGLIHEVGGGLAAMQRTWMDAHLAVLQEIARALAGERSGSEAPALGDPSITARVEPVAPTVEAVGTETGPVVEAGATEAEPLSPPAEPEAGEAAKPRRGRRSAVAG
ncbi:MAG: hypothetical protein K6T74_04270 [Geminicoccaceae bacterium]|nr:hypothetical protein [Geminicoccaceae bacterium]